MERRSFFGVMFGGLLARLRGPLPIWGGRDPTRRVVLPSGRVPAHAYRFGFTGFKPAQAFHYHKMEGGSYKPGDTFEIVGPGGPGTGPLRKVDIADDSD